MTVTIWERRWWNVEFQPTGLVVVTWDFFPGVLSQSLPTATTWFKAAELAILPTWSGTSTFASSVVGKVDQVAKPALTVCSSFAVVGESRDGAV